MMLLMFRRLGWLICHGISVEWFDQRLKIDSVIYYRQVSLCKG